LSGQEIRQGTVCQVGLYFASQRGLEGVVIVRPGNLHPDEGFEEFAEQPGEIEEYC